MAEIIPTGYMDSILRTSEVLKQAKPHEPTNYQRYGYGEADSRWERIKRNGSDHYKDGEDIEL